MRDTVFGETYSRLYDWLYQDKDYEGECDLIQSAIHKYHRNGEAKTILDLGCGSGSHAILLGKRGFQVRGIDRSEAMLEQARKKTLETDFKPGEYTPQFFRGDLQSINLKADFDVALMMFAVLGYQYTNYEVADSLKAVRSHLKPDGLFIFDVWYGPAVLAIRPSERFKIIPTAEGKILRTASGSLNTAMHLAEVRYHLWEINRDCKVTEGEETHLMRYFFPQELGYFLEKADLELLSLTEFGSLTKEPTEETWNVLGVARAM